MCEQWYAVVVAETGELYSVGTVIADPMPAEFLAVALSDADAARLNAGEGVWDAATRAVVPA